MKRIVKYIGIILTAFIFISVQIIYIYMYNIEGDKEMMNIKYQQKTFLSSLIIVFGIVDIVLIVVGFYYLKNRMKKSKLLNFTLKNGA